MRLGFIASSPGTMHGVTDDVPSSAQDSTDHRRPASLLNSLRAGVLGANDGIVSIAGVVVGVAGATTNLTVVLTAGVAALLAGALSMAAGEYVSVSTQRDTELALLRREKRALRTMPDQGLEELTQVYRAKGLSRSLARRVAEELTATDAFRAHAEAELRIDPDDLNSPWQASLASCAAFTAGALLPLVAIALPPVTARVPVCFAAVVLALALTGAISARLGNAPVGRATVRTVAGGAFAMAVTYGIGTFSGVQV